MKTIQYKGVVSPWYDTLGGSGLTWTTGMRAELEDDVADELLGYVTLFSFISESGSSVTLPTMQAAFDAGTAPEKAAFQSSVSRGRLVLAASGSLATPVATISAATAGSFTLPSKTIPAGFMIPGKSSISGTVLVRRVGANGTAVLTVTIGPADSSSDSSLYSSTMAATTNNDLRAAPEGFVSGVTRITTPVWLTPGSSGVSAALDRTSGFDVAAEQFVGVRIASANAADVFHLIAYRLVIESAV